MLAQLNNFFFNWRWPGEQLITMGPEDPDDLLLSLEETTGGSGHYRGDVELQGSMIQMHRPPCYMWTL